LNSNNGSLFYYLRIKKFKLNMKITDVYFGLANAFGFYPESQSQDTMRINLYFYINVESWMGKFCFSNSSFMK